MSDGLGITDYRSPITRYGLSEGTKMTKVKDFTIDDLECLIEQKVLEILGDPDCGLELKDEFKEELRERLKKPSKRISHQEAIIRFG